MHSVCVGDSEITKKEETIRMSQYLGFEPTNSKNYFFISYSSEDAERLTPVVKSLSEKTPLWYDYGLPYGKNWHREITDRIEHAEAVILFLSKQVLAKGSDSYVYTEYTLAKNIFHKTIYVVQIEDIQKADIPNELLIWWIELERYQRIIADPRIKSESLAEQILHAVTGKRKTRYCLCDEDGNIYELSEGFNSIGREPDINSIVIHKGCISRCHAIIRVEGDSLVISDMASTNGTFINGIRLDPKERDLLRAGDEVVLGNDRFILKTINS